MQICCSDPLCHGESFHPSLLPFLFDWWAKRWEITEEMQINCTAYTYYVMLMVKCMCTWLHHPLKLLLSVVLACINLNQPGWFHVETYMHVFGLWFTIIAATKIVIKHIQLVFFFYKWFLARHLNESASIWTLALIFYCSPVQDRMAGASTSVNEFDSVVRG